MQNMSHWKWQCSSSLASFTIPILMSVCACVMDVAQLYDMQPNTLPRPPHWTHQQQAADSRQQAAGRLSSCWPKYLIDVLFFLYEIRPPLLSNTITFSASSSFSTSSSLDYQRPVRLYSFFFSLVQIVFLFKFVLPWWICLARLNVRAEGNKFPWDKVSING